MEGERALNLIRKIREKLPDVALRTSLLVGFPGEGKEEFDDLESFVWQARFDHLGVFSYSREEGTDCFVFGDPVKESIKQKRKERIMELQMVISEENNKKYFKKKIDVLIEGVLKENPKMLVGRGPFQAPEVDGVVLIDAPERASEAINTIQKVEIKGCDVYDLYGKLCA